MDLNWFDMSPLKYSEAIELLNRSHNERLEMESKNLWDAYVNGFPFEIFVRDAFGAMVSDIRYEIKSNDYHDNYQYLPKRRDLYTLISFITEDDELKRPMRDILENQVPKKPIWSNVEAWWRNLFKQCLEVEDMDNERI